jgi:hypothetical protein
VLAAYAVPAMAMWAVIGLLLAALPIALVALGAVVLYGCGYGAVEILGTARPSAPGRNWQVPQDLMIGASGRRRVLVWGAVLGPGFLTRNPYAGFGALPLLLASLGSVPVAVAVAALVGMAHGSARALALLRDAARLQPEPIGLLLRSLRWRTLDGLGLLAVAGAGLATAAARLW